MPLRESHSIRRVDKYELVAALGVGGMAAVYRGRMQGVGGASKEVAVKVIQARLRDDEALRLMFFDEMRLAMALTHRNIVQTFDVGESGGEPYMVMELVEGTSLQALCARCGPLPLADALFIAMEVSSALDYAHGLVLPAGRHAPGVIHRDICPNNILLSFNGDVKLADFGVAKAAGRLVQTAPNVVKGKLRYMAPEQAAGQATPEADIFALGAVLYEMIAGLPFRGGQSLTELLQGRLALPVGLNRPGLSASIEALVRRCLEDLPRHRPTASELRQALADEHFRLQVGSGAAADPHQSLRSLMAKGERGTSGTEGAAARIAALLAEQSLGSGVEAVRVLRERHPPQEPQAPTAPTAPMQQALTAAPAAVASPLAPPALTVDQRRGSGGRAPPPRPRWMLPLSLVALGAAGLALGASQFLSTPEEVRPSLAPPAPASGAGLRLSASSRDGSQGVVPARTPDAKAALASVPATTPPSAPALSPHRAPSALPRPAPGPPLRPHRHPIRRRSGWLEVNSLPWARVYLDGRYVGTTPIQRHRVAVGAHRIKLVAPGRQGLSRAMTVHIHHQRRTKVLLDLRPASAGR